MDYENINSLEVSEINNFYIDNKLIRNFPGSTLKENRLIPLTRHGDTVVVISDNYPPPEAINDLEVYTGFKIDVRLEKSHVVQQLVNEHLKAPVDTVEDMLDDNNLRGLDDFKILKIDSRVENLEDLAQEAPIIRLVNAIITTALKKGASDIHIEPFEDKLRLRYRIDGVLYENPAPPLELLPAIITRIKIMSELNIAERRLPQEGRIRIRVSGRELDIRVSIIPALHGEGVVLRLLDKAARLLDIKNLGFSEAMLKRYLNLINIPHGIILVTGPTGSGKTTTLYATLQYLNSSSRKIITIEDPVEYQLEGINQIQVKPEINFDFASGLRSILRHDPDIIMIGEIRDVETAKIAIQAALTGHLVLATLHTNDAAGAVSRLLNMGVEDYLLAATLKGILAQRLVRVLCPRCKESYQPTSSEVNLIDDDVELLYRPAGCTFCNNIGFKGRTGIYELLTVTPQIESMIVQRASSSEIKEELKKTGYTSLFTDGCIKVKDGLTSIDEVVRVTTQ